MGVAMIYRLHVPGNKETWGFEIEATQEQVDEMKADGVDITGPYEDEDEAT